MLNIREAIIVEGKYDKIKLSSVVNTVIISTDGFGVFANKAKQELIKRLAKEKGIIILTDSDRAGFIIRNFICGIVDNKYIKHAYIPQINGVERRKSEGSKDGFLGVEGIDNKTIENAIRFSAKTKAENDKKLITKKDLYLLGLSGRADSAKKRDELLKFLDLPLGITANPLIDILNSLYSYDEFCDKINEFLQNRKM